MLATNCWTVTPEVIALKGETMGNLPGIRSSYVLLKGEGGTSDKVAQAISLARLREFRVRPTDGGNEIMAGEPADDLQFRKIAFTTDQMGPFINEQGFITSGWVIYDKVEDRLYINGRPPKHGMVVRFNTGLWGHQDRTAEYIVRMPTLEGSDKRCMDPHGVNTRGNLSVEKEDLDILLGNEHGDEEPTSGRRMSTYVTGGWRSVRVPSRARSDGTIPTVSVPVRSTSLWTFREDGQDAFASGCFPGSMFRVINDKGKPRFESLQGDRWRDVFLESTFDFKQRMSKRSKTERARILPPEAPPAEAQVQTA